MCRAKVSITCVVAGELVNLQAQVAGLVRDVGAENFLRLGERDVFVVAGFGFGRGCEDRFGQLG
jgi:hypothetical protein